MRGSRAPKAPLHYAAAKNHLLGGVREPGLRAASAAPNQLYEPDFHAATLHRVHGVLGRAGVGDEGMDLFYFGDH